jgi:DNA mismatch endonuclease (patch repair protein)
MTDMFSREERSRIMSTIRSRGNIATELRFIEIVRKHKIVGWRRGSVLPGKPDFVFARQHVVVFLDGDFWHGNSRKFRIPKSNVAYWTKKILSNKRRDRLVNLQLRTRGWRVIRFWQSSLKNEARVVARLRRVLNLCLSKGQDRMGKPPIHEK